MRNSFIPIAISLTLLAAPPVRAAPPRHAEITFQLLHDGSAVAQIVDRFEHDAKTYSIDETWKGDGIFALLGKAERTSRGTIGPYGLRPVEFEDRRTGRATARATFDWKAETLTLQDRGAPQTRALPADAQDKLSFAYAFAFDVPGGKPVTIQATDGRGLSTYVFQVTGRVRLKTPAGEFEALKLVKRKDGPGDKGTEVWLAVDHGYLPIRVLVTDKDGTRLDQVVTHLETR
jgi:Protein of unknown function (DUF3108)